MSLLDKALAAKVSGRKRAEPSADELELALAFYRGAINYRQVTAALGKPAGHTGAVGNRMSSVIRNAVIAGRLKLVRS